MANDRPKKCLLIIDDDRLFCQGVRAVLASDRLRVLEANTKMEGLALCAGERVDLVLLDQQLPDGDGVELCAPILSYHDRTKIIFITAYPSFENALAAVKLGAYDYLTKPIDLNALEMVVAKAERVIDLERVEEVHDYREEHKLREQVLIGGDGGLREVQDLVELAGRNLVPVLITGETGTGKSLVAAAIHRASPLRNEAFVQINCAAIPENLMESELFGHEKGAFTGAISTRKGIFELAEGGTLLLDELGELPVALQSKLLGVLDDNRVRRIGGNTARHVNVRVVAATNVDLNQAVSDGRFRQDLFYRLGVILIHLPPLRHRRQDLPALCQHLVGSRRAADGVVLPEDELARLAEYHWPGNVRELKNVIERAIILSRGREIRPSQLIEAKPLPDAASPVAETTTPPSLKEVEMQYIQRILDRSRGNQSRAARILGISRSTLLRKLAGAPK